MIYHEWCDVHAACPWMSRARGTRISGSRRASCRIRIRMISRVCSYSGTPVMGAVVGVVVGPRAAQLFAQLPSRTCVATIIGR